MWIGLAVSAENVRARALYAGHGYVDSGISPFLAGGTYLDRSGQRRSWEEVCVYLRKRLR